MRRAAVAASILIAVSFMLPAAVAVQRGAVPPHSAPTPAPYITGTSGIAFFRKS